MKSFGRRALCALLAGVPALAIAQGDAVPLSRDALFDVEPEPETRPAEPPAAPASLDALFELPAAGGRDDAAVEAKPEEAPGSVDALFGLSPGAEKTGDPAPDAAPPASREALSEEPPARPAIHAGSLSPWQGYVQTELAYTYASPDHWSKVMARLELGRQGRLGQGVRWKASGRVDYNPVYDLTHFYQESVRDDQRLEFDLRETYLDFAAGGLEWRVGRQHIVWGEMVGLFFADVVSAKDLREFVLPDFQVLRIPQWAARAEYYKNDFHAELIWIPFPSYDRIGEPRDFSQPGSGADFYPYPATPAGVPVAFRNEDTPGTRLSHTNYGLRLSRLVDGWDMTGFYYSSMDSSATYYREAVGPLLAPTAYIYRPTHERIWQVGGTLAKDLGDFVLKAEAVYTDGRRYNVTRLDDVDGVARQDALDWVVGLDFNPTPDTRLNTQLFQRIFFDHDPDIIPDRYETGFSVLLNHKFPRNWEAEAMLISSLNRSDWLLRPKLVWGVRQDWRLAFGLDIFSGPADGLLGRYDHLDRVYAEMRHDF